MRKVYFDSNVPKSLEPKAGVDIYSEVTALLAYSKIICD